MKHILELTKSRSRTSLRTGSNNVPEGSKLKVLGFVDAQVLCISHIMVCVQSNRCLQFQFCISLHKCILKHFKFDLSSV